MHFCQNSAMIKPVTKGKSRKESLFQLEKHEKRNKFIVSVNGF